MKSTHFRFRGPNNFLRACVDFPLDSSIEFSTPIRSISMPRSIDVLKNDRKFLSVCSMFAKWNRRIFVFGAQTIFFGFALICFRFKSRLYDGDSIDVDALLDRGAQKRIQFMSMPVSRCALNQANPFAPSFHSIARARAMPYPFHPPLLPSLLSPSSSSFLLFLYFPPCTTFHKDKIKCAPITRENLVNSILRNRNPI